MKYFIVLGLGLLASLYFFPVSFVYLPEGLNSKIMIGLLGCAFFLFNGLRIRDVKFSNQLIGAMVIAAFFSFSCLLSCEINNTYDYAYATYIVSFFTWLMGAYGLCELIRIYHGKATLILITLYLAGVCAVQSISALLIDSIPAVERAVNSVIAQDVAFFKDVDRLYGIGAALDPAGVRFSIVLILIVHLFHTKPLSKFKIYYLWICFALIVVLGNMISRTTSVGAVLALAYLLGRSLIIKKEEGIEYAKVYVPFISLLALSIILVIFYYRTNAAFHDNMRFAFEGFFNWIEKGEWRTDSTDKLNNVMWVWPTDIRTWIWGSGLFENFVFSTDIGYCRFILYCGLVGFSIFVFFFGYNSWAVYSLKKIDAYLALLLFVFSLIIWVKVATDIFMIFAILFCLDEQTAEEEEVPDLVVA